MLLIVFCFGRGIRAAHCCLFWEGDPCRSSFFALGEGSVLIIVFVLGGGSVLLIVVCFGRGIRVAHRFWFSEGDPCCSSFFVLGG